MDIQAIRQGIATNAATVVSVPALTTFGYVPEIVPEPCLFTAEIDITFDTAYGRGLDECMVTCRVLVGRSDDRSAQALLNGYLNGDGAASLKQAIESAPTLGGACDDVRVVRVQGFRFYIHGEKNYYGAELIVHVIGNGE